MSALRILLAAMLVLPLLGGSVLAADDADVQEQRYRRLVHELRCLVCQNQSIAESNAPLAEDLRRQVRRMIAEGRSDQEILDYMSARYGDFVRYRPPWNARTAALWLAPVGLLLLGFLLLRAVARQAASAGAEHGDGTSAESLRRRLEDEGP